MPPTNLERLIAALAIPPGRHVGPDAATLDMIRTTIKKLTTEHPVPPRCVALQTEYTKKLQAANNAVRGGGHLSNFGLVWNNFINAALVFVQCVIGAPGAP